MHVDNACHILDLDLEANDYMCIHQYIFHSLLGESTLQCLKIVVTITTF
jgi:hypothetical protein